LRCHRLLVMPKAASKSDRRHSDDDCNGENSAHRKIPLFAPAKDHKPYRGVRL
jgi:hypothetical protein